jgi:uncharacterized membrane protein YeaQ/YmgE (transglycosylase-associated protein family)
VEAGGHAGRAVKFDAGSKDEPHSGRELLDEDRVGPESGFQSYTQCVFATPTVCRIYREESMEYDHNPDLIMSGRDPGGIIVTILTRMVGAVVGGFIVQGLLGLRGGFVLSIMLATIGAILLLTLYGPSVGQRRA